MDEGGEGGGPTQATKVIQRCTISHWSMVDRSTIAEKGE